jgi:hypothetical protein
MWGTIAKMRLKPDVSADYAVAQMNAFDRKRIGG